MNNHRDLIIVATYKNVKFDKVFNKGIVKINLEDTTIKPLTLVVIEC